MFLCNYKKEKGFSMLVKLIPCFFKKKTNRKDYFVPIDHQFLSPPIFELQIYQPLVTQMLILMAI